MKNYAAKTIDEYIAHASKGAQPKLKELRKLIQLTIPEAEESIKWGIPFYMYHGMLGGFSVFKSHISFGLGGPRLSAKLRADLLKKGYTTGSKIIQIKFDQKIPTAVIKGILKNQARINKAQKGINK